MIHFWFHTPCRVCWRLPQPLTTVSLVAQGRGEPPSAGPSSQTNTHIYTVSASVITAVTSHMMNTTHEVQSVSTSLTLLTAWRSAGCCCKWRVRSASSFVLRTPTRPWNYTRVSGAGERRGSLPLPPGEPPQLSCYYFSPCLRLFFHTVNTEVNRRNWNKVINIQ